MLKRPVLGAIRFYQRGISPFLPAACRFYPSCSEYALQAVQRFGVGRGGMLAARRLLRCQPFCKGGYDPVPLPVPPQQPAGAGDGVPNRTDGR